MYEQMSPETGEFINFMYDNALMDVLSAKGKAAGGYCTEILEYKSPFIFSNFNGTSGDVDVLTHEAGHAFAYYSVRDKMELCDQISPTMESCEVHSMSMEFFAWPWHELFTARMPCARDLCILRAHWSFCPTARWSTSSSTLSMTRRS